MSARMVSVRWTDSFSANHGWSDTQELAKEVGEQKFEIESIGFLLRRDKKHIVLMQSLRTPHGDQCADTIAIPVGCILSVRRLQYRCTK